MTVRRVQLLGRVQELERGATFGLKQQLWTFYTDGSLPEDPERAGAVVALCAWSVVGRVLLGEGEPEDARVLWRQAGRGETSRYIGTDTMLSYAGRRLTDEQLARWDALWTLERELRPPREQLGDLRYR